MRAIQKSNYQLPLFLKWVIVLICIIALTTLFISIKYAGKNKTGYPLLSLNEQLAVPTCDHKGGFVTQPFYLQLHSENELSTIYYTLDGTEPSLKSSVYTGPVLIGKPAYGLHGLASIPTSPRWMPAIDDVNTATVLRAITVTSNNKKSRELIRTFFIEQQGEKRYTLPVVALTINPEDFFDYKKGIYVLGKNYEDKRDYIRKNIPLDLPWWQYPSNYLKKGNNSSRPIHIEFYDEKTNGGFEQNATVRIHGNKTRGFSQKSLRIIFNENKTGQLLNYPLFQGDSINKFSTLVLRNGGNDWSKTLFRDEFMQSLMSDTKMEQQRYRPCIVFLNGEYWGIHNIRERYDEYYFSIKYNLSPDSLIILESGTTLLHGKKSDLNEFVQLLHFVKNNDLHKDVVYRQFKRMVDMENLMDFIIANVYCANADWQEKIWRYRTTVISDSLHVKDGRWRWVLYDMDWGFGYTGTGAVELNMLDAMNSKGCIGVIFHELLKNQEFIKTFKERFNYHLNTTFEPRHVLKKIDAFEQLLKPEMQEHINRWRVIGSLNKWENNVQELRDFALKRPSVQRSQLDKFLKKQTN